MSLELLNQHRDQDHYKRDIECGVKEKPTDPKFGCFRYYDAVDKEFIPFTDLEWNRAKQTQYLKNDCLKFRIIKITMLEIEP